MGYAPICVHPSILLGALGDDDDPKQRAAGIHVALRLMEAADQVWALTRDDGSLSRGMLLERSHWHVGLKRSPVDWLVSSWADWSKRLKRYGVS